MGKLTTNVQLTNKEIRLNLLKKFLIEMWYKMPAYKKTIVGIHKDDGGIVRRVGQTLGRASFYYCDSCSQNSALGNLSYPHDVYVYNYTSALKKQVTQKLGVAYPGQNYAGYGEISSALGIGLYVFECSWDDREPTQGTFDFEGLDRRILYTHAAGAKPYLIFSSDAAWGIPDPKPTTARNHVPNDIEEWKTFVTKVAKRYTLNSGETVDGLTESVIYYGFPNEWNSATNKNGGWGGTFAQLATTFNHTYQAIKAVNPQAKVSIGGLTSAGANGAVVALDYGDYDIILAGDTTYSPTQIKAGFMTQVLDATQLYADITSDYVDCHYYGPTAHDDPRIAFFKDMSNLSRAEGLITTEFGGPGTLYQATVENWELFTNPIERYARFIQNNFPVMTWFSMGTSTPSGQNYYVPMTYQGTYRPQFYAHQFLAHILQDNSTASVVGDCTCIFVTTNDQTSYVVFNKSDQTEFVVPSHIRSNSYYRIIEPDSGKFLEEAMPSSRTITLGRLPVYIR